MQLPSIHMNGTSQESLVKDQVDVLDLLRKAFEKMAQTGPHGRDYYFQKDPDAFLKARFEWQRRYLQIEAVYKEIERYALAIQDGGHQEK